MHERNMFPLSLWVAGGVGSSPWRPRKPPTVFMFITGRPVGSKFPITTVQYLVHQNCRVVPQIKEQDGPLVVLCVDMILGLVEGPVNVVGPGDRVQLVALEAQESSFYGRDADHGRRGGGGGSAAVTVALALWCFRHQISPVGRIEDYRRALDHASDLQIQDLSGDWVLEVLPPSRGIPAVHEIVLMGVGLQGYLLIALVAVLALLPEHPFPSLVHVLVGENMVPFLARPVFDVIPRRGPLGVCCCFEFGFVFGFTFVGHVVFLPQDHLPDNLVQEALDRGVVFGAFQGKFKDEVLRIGIAGAGGLGFVLLNVLVPPVTNLVEPFHVCSRKDVVVD